MKIVKQFWVCLILAGLCGSASAQEDAKPKRLDNSALFADEVLATGKGVEIKRSQLDAAITGLNSSLAATGQSMPQIGRAAIESKVLDQLVFTRLLLNHGTPEERQKATAEADKYIADAKVKLSSPEAFNRRIESLGMTVESFRTRAHEDALKKLVVDREVAAKVTISDEVAKKYYEDNPKRFEQPETVHVIHILLTTVDPTTRQDLSEERQKEKKETINKLLVRARGGEDFSKLVKDYSEDPGSKERGGEYIFTRGQMDPEFESAAFALEVNQISEVVVTRFGYHIIKVLEKTPAKKLAYAEISERLKEELRSEEVVKQLPDYYEKLKKEAEVKILLTESK